MQNSPDRHGDYRHGQAQKIGVLLSNLGTPADKTPAAARRYLREFLSDPRIVDLPPWLWRLVLHGVILRIRPRRSAHAYAKVWTAEGSPLLVYAQRQRDGVAALMRQAYGDRVVVELGMRYGAPSIASALARLHEAGARHILVVPLYPQYSSATTASTFDAVSAAFGDYRWVPDVRFLSSYYREDWYIDCLAASVRDAWRVAPQGERLLFSFHGMPVRSRAQGDPYHCQCQQTARRVAEVLGLADGAWAVAFQSRFGPAQWLQPYTDRTLLAWAGQGIRRVDVICPGFSADCLETLEEIAMQNHDLFLSAGGEGLRYIPALNDREDHVRGLTAMIGRHLCHWPTAAEPEAAREASRRRALAMGATD